MSQTHLEEARAYRGAHPFGTHGTEAGEQNATSLRSSIGVEDYTEFPDDRTAVLVFETVRHSQIMLCELSHDLPWLETSGTRILRSDTMQPALLRGVNRSGLEYTEPIDGGFLAAAGFTEDEVRRIVSDWGANIIRVPFNQDWALRGRKDCSPEEYRASLDQVISWASALGAYTILDLQWL